MRALLLPTCLAAVLLASCGTSRCEPPAGCQRTAQVGGTCQCAEWQPVRVDTLPIKFVVVSVLYGGIGKDSWLVYGWTGPSGGMPVPASSDLGARLRATMRDASGTPHAAAMVNDALGGALAPVLRPVTPQSAAALLAWGDGAGSGSADGWGNTYDAPGLAEDAVVVWVNPTLTMTTDYAGGREASWGWTSVGHCYWPLQLPCEGPHFLNIPVAALDGSRPPGDTYTAEFLATLSAEERASILRYHPLYDPPGRDPSTLAADPRFQALGFARVAAGSASYPTGTWKPCEGTLSDVGDEVLHQEEIPVAGSSERVLLQHAVLSRQATCQTQQPGIVLATSTPDCSVAADVYMDRMFGTVLFVPTAVAASCTKP
jgi:hypothetical protein